MWEEGRGEEGEGALKWLIYNGQGFEKAKEQRVKRWEERKEEEKKKDLQNPWQIHRHEDEKEEEKEDLISY